MKKFKSYILVAMMGLTVSSCEDFLTLMPLNEVVLENFYTNEADVESVLRSAYAALESSDCMVRMSAWGEMRSDNIVDGTDNSGNGDDDLVRFINENINYQNSLTTYLCFYKAINYANTVLHYAPEVHAKDPNYHGSELAAHQAEAISIRCLSYWYLIRAFKDVPYTTQPSIDDTNDFFIGQSPFDSILNCLITDLESVKIFAPIHYSSDFTKKSNTARFTRAAINAMLADMYLWKGDWDKCIACCEYITESKKEDYKKIKADKGLDCDIEPEQYNKYPLILETFGSDNSGNAYNAIFGQGNSFESIFELPFDRTTSNPFVSSYYNSSSSTTGKLKASDLIKRGEGGDYLFAKKDVRFYQNIASDKSPGIVKYVYSEVKCNLKTGEGQENVGTRRGDNAAEPNWIIYRYTDVLLMEAEAYTMKARDLKDQGAAETVVNDTLKKAFDIVDAVNMRATCYPKYGTDTRLSYIPNNDPDVLEELVFDERRRELMFEGKRWFDLVRQAMRNGNADNVSEAVKSKTENSNSSVISVKFSNLNGLFLPINKDEIDINSRLKQNAVYTDNEHIKKAK